MRVLDLETGKEQRHFDAPGGSVHALAFRPDGKALARSGRPRAVWLWDLNTGRQVWKRDGLPSGVQRLAFSPDGTTLAGTDGSVGILHLWEVASGRERWRSPDLGTWPSSLALAPDGRRLAVGLSDSTALVFDVAPGR